MCKAVTPTSLQRAATSWAANIAAYGEDSSRSALTFIPPVTRTMVSRPLEEEKIKGSMKRQPLPLVISFFLCIYNNIYIYIYICPQNSWLIGWDTPEIGNVDESIIERSEDTGDTEDKFAYFLAKKDPKLAITNSPPLPSLIDSSGWKSHRKGNCALTITNLGSQRDIFFLAFDFLSFWSHGNRLVCRWFGILAMSLVLVELLDQFVGLGEKLPKFGAKWSVGSWDLA